MPNSFSIRFNPNITQNCLRAYQSTRDFISNHTPEYVAVKAFQIQHIYTILKREAREECRMVKYYFKSRINSLLTPEIRAVISYVFNIVSRCFSYLKEAFLKIGTFGFYREAKRLERLLEIEKRKNSLLQANVTQLENQTQQNFQLAKDLEQQNTSLQLRLQNQSNQIQVLKRSIERKEENLKQIQQEHLLTSEILKSKLEENGDKKGFLSRLWNSKPAPSPESTSSENLRIKITRLELAIVEREKALIAEKSEYSKLQNSYDSLNTEALSLKAALNQFNTFIGKITPSATQTKPKPTFINFDPTYLAPHQSAQTMDQLLALAFEHAFNSLLDESKEGIIQLNRANNITYLFHNMQAVYRRMVLNLLRGAKLELAGCDGSWQVVLKKDIIVSTTMPSQVLIHDSNSELPLKVTPRYETVNSWTPSIHEYALINGIDPVSAKTILHELSEVEIGCLDVLLLEPLIPGNNPILAHAASMRAENPKINQATLLIGNLAFAVSKNFTHVFSKQWETLAHDEELEAFNKNTTPLNSTSIKTPYISWEPKWDLIHVDTQMAIREAKDNLLDPYWEALSADVLAKMPSKKLVALPPAHTNAFTVLSNYYYHIHTVTRHGCLFSAIATYLFQDPELFHSQNRFQGTTEIIERHIASLKKAMADFLDKEPGRYTNDIQAATGRSRQVYMSWLKGNHDIRSKFVLGDPELELISQVLGLRIVVLDPGSTIYSPEGLILPSPFSARSHIYGPNTKSKIILYNNPDHTYVALMPKVDVEKAEPAKREALQMVDNFWKERDGQNFWVHQE